MTQVNLCNKVDNFYCENVSFNNTKKAASHSDSIECSLMNSSRLAYR